MAGNVEFGIRITADGKVAVVESGNVKRALDEIGKSADGVAAKTGKVREGLESISSGVNLLAKLNIGTLGFNIALEALTAFRDSMLNLPSIGREFQASMETNQLGMAGILASMTQMNGKALDFGRAMSISSDMMAKLNQDAIRTAASTAELVNAYRALLGPGMAANMSLEQIRQLTVTGVNAVKSMGLPAQQVVQELRDLVAGGITAASSTLATALGLRDEDIAKAKGSAEGLFAFLMKRLSGFTEAADMYNDTISGISSAMKEKLTLAAAEGFKSLTEASKESMKVLTEIISSRGLVDALKSISDALVYMGFMLKAAFSIAKEFLLSAALVAGGYAIASAIAAVNAATALAAGSMALLNKEAVMFVFGATLAKLETLGAGAKGGLVGLALFGGWEFGTFLSGFEVIRKGVASVLDPVFRFFDRSDGAMLDKLADRLAQLKKVMAEASIPNFEKTNAGQIRVAEIANTERQIAEIRKRMGLDGASQGAGAPVASKEPSLNVGILEQSYQKLIGTVKTATAIEKEYHDQLSASRKQYVELAAAKAGAGAPEKELMALAKQQDQYEAGIAKKRADELRALGKESTEMQNARIDAALKLREVEIGASLEQNASALKLGTITQSDHDQTKAMLDAQKNVEQQIATQQKLGVSGLTEGQRQALHLTLQRLTLENQAINQKGENEAAINRKKAIDEEQKGYDELRKGIDALSASETKRLDDAIKAQELHNAEIGKTAEQKELERQSIETAAAAQLKFEADALRIAAETVDMDQRYKDMYTARANALDLEADKRKQLAGLLADGARREANSAAVKKQIEDFKNLWDGVEKTGKDAFTHIFSDGKTAFEGIGKAIKASVIDLLYQLTAKKWFVSVGLGVTGSMASGASSAATSAGGSMLGSLGSSLMGGAMQTGADLGNFFGSIGSVAESGATFGVMDALSGFAMANPWTAAAAAVLAVVGGSSLFGGSEDPNRGKYEYSGLSSTDTITRKGGLAGNYYDFYGALGATFNDIPQNQLTGINNAISQVFDQMEKQAKDAGIAVTGLDNLTVRMAVTGQGVQKDLENAILATGDAIASQLIPGIENLQIKGETLAQTFGRITAATIAAKAAEDARLAEIAKVKQGWQDQLDVLTGVRTQTEIDRAVQLAAVSDEATLAIMNQVYAAQDLAKAQAEATQAQVEAAQAQADAAQAAADATATFKDSLTVLISQGRSVRDFLNTLGATGVSMSLATSRNAYIADLLAARAGDADAYGRITKSAGDYIKAGESYSASGNAQRALVGQIKAELSALTPVAALDANTELLKLITAATESTALSTGNLDALGITALFDLSAVLTVIENSEGLSPELKLLMKENTKTYSMILSAALAGGASDPLKKVLIDGEGIYSASVKALLDDAGIDAASRKLALTAQGDFVAYVDAVMKSDAPSDSKKLALGTNNDILALVNASLNPVLDPEAKKLGLALGSDLERTVNAVWKSGYDQTAIDYANLAVTDIARSVSASFASGYSEESVAFAGLQATDLARIVDASFKGGYSENAVIFASLQATDISRLVDAAFTQEHSQTAVDFALAKAADMTALTRSVMGSLTGDETADALLLSKAQATANVFKTEVTAYLAEDEETQKMAALLNGTGSGKLEFAGQVTFDASAPLESIFNAISANTKLTSTGTMGMLEALIRGNGANLVRLENIANLLLPQSVVAAQKIEVEARTQGDSPYLGWQTATWTKFIEIFKSDIATKLSSFQEVLNNSVTNTIKSVKHDAGIPGFAEGGIASGWAVVGEGGPELVDFATPGRVYTAGQTRAAMGAANDDLLAEIKALRAEVAGLRGEAVKTSANTRKTADAIVRVTRDGESMLTATA